MSMNILAIDYGKRRVGLALKTDMGIAELPALVWSKPFELRDALAQIVADYAVELVIVGMPHHGPLVPEITVFVQELSEHIPVVTMDETLSSSQATHELSERGVRAKKQKKQIDSVAARLILEEYMTYNQL